MRGNCISYAVGRFLSERGGYVVLRRSRFYPGPHVFYSRDLATFESFVPVDTRWFRKRRVPPLWFTGRIKRWTGSE